MFDMLKKMGVKELVGKTSVPMQREGKFGGGPFSMVMKSMPGNIGGFSKGGKVGRKKK